MSNRQDAASALLELKRHVLTGREIELCERMQSGDFEADEEMEHQTRDATRCPHCNEFVDKDLYEVDSEKIEEDNKTFRSLEIQFASEIADWIADRDRRASRERVEAHQRIQDAKDPQPQLL